MKTHYQVQPNRCPRHPCLWSPNFVNLSEMRGQTQKAENLIDNQTLITGNVFNP